MAARSFGIGNSVFVLAGLLACAVPWGWLWADQFKTVHDTGVWASSKSDSRKGVIGGGMSMVTRPVFGKHYADLGAWFGFQELYLREPRAIRSVSFGFAVPEHGHLSVLFDTGGTNFTHLAGFRMSANADKPSAYVETGRKRLFTEFEPIRELELTGAWQIGEVRFEGELATLSIDGVEIMTRPFPLASHRRVGFRGSTESVFFDDLEVVHEEDGDLVTFASSFDRRDLWLRTIGAAGLGAGTLLAGLYWLFRRIRLRRAPLAAAMGVTFVVAILGWSLWAMDRNLWSVRYPLNPLQNVPYQNGMFLPEQPDLAWEERYPDLIDLPRFRIQFIGGSQTWGSGAMIEGDVWTRLVERQLNDLGHSRGYECINRGRSGAKTHDLLRDYREKWVKWDKPHLMVLNVGHNDTKTYEFAQNLVQFWVVSQEHDVEIAFVQEANTRECARFFNAKRLDDKHQAMGKLAGAGGVPLIDMHAYFRENHDRGYLWWDSVHQTSAGQQLMADEMARRLAQIVAGD